MARVKAQMARVLRRRWRELRRKWRNKAQLACVNTRDASLRRSWRMLKAQMARD